MERLGIPTLTVVTTDFFPLAKEVAAAENASNFCFATVPHPMGAIPADSVMSKAETAFPEILKLAKDWEPAPESISADPPPYPAERFTYSGTSESLNSLFFDQGWSLGLPVIPPVAESVNRMLAGTSRAPDEVIGLVPPRLASLTVELLAAHAVMAGCKPDHMPVLVAALEALMAKETSWLSALTTTATIQTVVVVNGPAVKKIGLASGQGSAGKGHRANAAIGYAINLVGYVVGGSRPPSVDKSTLGSPADHVCWVFGENEDQLPPGWKAMHVDRGFDESQSVVTVSATYTPVENVDHWSASYEQHMRWWSTIINPLLGVGGPCAPISLEQTPIVALAPEHAQLIASKGKSKEDFKRSLWEQARIPLSIWPQHCAGMPNFLREYGNVSPDSMIPLTWKPEQFLVVLAGGAGKHSHYFAPFPGCFASSRTVSP